MSRFLFAIFAFFISVALAEAEPVDSGHALVELVADRVETQAGSEFYAGLKLELDENWHVYWRNAGDAGLPPMIIFSDNTDVATAPFEWPAPHLLPVVEGQIMDYGYEDMVILPFKVTVPDMASGRVTLEGVADFLICEDICIPEHADVRLEITVSERMIPDVINGELIGEAIAEVPVAFKGEVALARNAASWTLSLASPELAETKADLRFYPYTHSIIHAADQPLRTGAGGACLTLTPDINGNPDEARAPIEGVIIADHGKGDREAWAVSAADGAVLDETCTQIQSAAGASGGSINFISILFFALIGGLILNLMPCVLPVLSIKALGLVQAAASGERAQMRAHGIWYTAGVIISFAAIAVAFLAVRAAMGSASLGFQLQYPPAVAVLALVMFVIGLWLLGVFELGGSLIGTGSGLAAKQGNSGAFFTGILAAVVGAPCVGPFLGAALGAVLTQPALIVLAVFLVLGFGLALPFLVLSFAPGLQRLLPKPGPWMERLRQFFAFPMFLTAAWLVSVLMPLAGISATVWTLIGAILIGFGIWVWKTFGGRGALGLGLGGALLLAGVVLPVRASLKGTPLKTNVYSAKFETEVWSPTRVAELNAQGRGVFVDFTAVWCVNCQLNKATTLKKASVQKAFDDHDIAFLVADFTTRDPVIAAELQRHGSPGVPLYLYYPPGSTTPEVLPTLLSPGLVIGVIEGE